MISEKKARELVRSFLKECFTNGESNFELWRCYEAMVGNEAMTFQAYPTVIIGNGIFAVGETYKESVERLQKELPDRDWKMFEIDEYKGYFIAYD